MEFRQPVASIEIVHIVSWREPCLFDCRLAQLIVCYRGKVDGQLGSHRMTAVLGNFHQMTIAPISQAS
jgi:hypothetical protein